MTEAWRAMGPEAREIYVIQHLEEIVGTVVSKLNDVDVGEVHMLDQGDGSALASYAAAYPNAVAMVLRSLAETTGGRCSGNLGSTRGGTLMGFLKIVLILIVILFLAGVTLALVVKNLLYVCQPSEVLVFSGRPRTSAVGAIGYRIIKGGRGLRMPLIERVDRVDLTNMIIEITVRNAYSKGGIPLTVQGVANIKVPGEFPLLHNALERFLGRTRDEIMRVARETLEGNLRGVLATLTPEQVNEDKEAFAHPTHR